MHFYILLRAEPGRTLPTAADMRAAGFALASSVDPGHEDPPEPERTAPDGTDPERTDRTGESGTGNGQAEAGRKLASEKPTI